jgi:serine/threonine-protein kinase
MDQPLQVEQPGSIIGSYKLLEPIGEGGFGVVFLAEQERPVRRRVALKIIKPGMDTRQVIARFEAERQALAMMDHPNIAKVFDAGATEAGRPYFVMELVQGVPITEYCDQCNLTTRERLELFVSVCQAVQHAHQKGVIHRDLKPTNVLVAMQDGRPATRIIDFGVAKAISGNQRLTDQTLMTGFAQMMGTPLYMSPEQAELSPLGVDTRSDIYSLGVMLYELLTGTTPFDKNRLHAASYDELRRIIREEEPPRPSARISTLAAELATTVAEQRRTNPRRLSQNIRGDLDWIVMKCLDKDRSRRYETVSALAADIQRYLNDEPVLACSPSAAYRLRKFVKRKKVALAIAGCLLLTTTALVASIGWNVRDRLARQVAMEREVSLALQEATRLQHQANWTEAMSAAKRAKALLDANDITPQLRRQVQELLADLQMLGKLEQARLEGAAVRQRNSSFDSARTDAKYAEAFREYGIEVQALLPPTAAREIKGRNIRVELAAALDDWARARRATLRHQGLEQADTTWKHFLAVARAADPDPWRNRFRDAWETDSKQLERKALEKLAASAPMDQLAPSNILRLARLLNDLGATEQAVGLLQQVQQQYPADFWINQTLAFTLHHMQPPRLDEAIGFYRTAVALRPNSPGAHLNLGLALMEKGLPSEASAAYRNAIRLKPDYTTAYLNLGIALQNNGSLDEAIAAYRQAVRLKPDEAESQNYLGMALGYNGLWDEAQACFKDAVQLKPNDPAIHNNLGCAFRNNGALDEAIAAFREAIRLNPEAAISHANLADCLERKGLLDEAITACRDALRLKPDFADGHMLLGTALMEKGKSLKDSGAWAEGIAAWGEAIRLMPDDGCTKDNLAWSLLTNEDPTFRDESLALELAKDAVRLNPKHGNHWHTLGVAYYYAGDWNAAVEALEKGKSIDEQSDERHSSEFVLAMAHWRLGNKEEAIRIYEQANAWAADTKLNDKELNRFRAETGNLLALPMLGN